MLALHIRVVNIDGHFFRKRKWLSLFVWDDITLLLHHIRYLGSVLLCWFICIFLIRTARFSSNCLAVLIWSAVFIVVDCRIRSSSSPRSMFLLIVILLSCDDYKLLKWILSWMLVCVRRSSSIRAYFCRQRILAASILSGVHIDMKILYIRQRSPRSPWLHRWCCCRGATFAEASLITSRRECCLAVAVANRYVISNFWFHSYTLLLIWGHLM